MQKPGSAYLINLIALVFLCLAFGASHAETPVATPSPQASVSQATHEKPASQALAKRRILREKPRQQLTGFFKIGIALNIAMMLTFAWWAVRQWRLTGKSDKDS